MASAEKLPSGLYRGVYRDAAGRKRHTKAPHFKRMKDARDKAQELEVEARRNASHSQGATSAGITWGEWWDLLSQKRKLESETPVTEHYIVENFLRPQWGRTKLNHITRTAVQEWVDELRVGKSAGYTRRIYSVFSASINRALRDKNKVLLTSPCVEIDLPRRGKRPKPHTTVDDVAALRRVLRGDYADAIEFILETGLRPGELAGVHVDRAQAAIESGWLEVVEVYVAGKTAAIPPFIRDYPKDGDVRRVPLTDRAIELARQQLAGRALRTGCGLPHSRMKQCSGDLLFRSRRGGPVSPKNLQQALVRGFRNAGLAYKSPYASRRGFATRLAEGGANAFEIAEWMGHSDVNMSQEYVQQTAAARGRLRAALGEQVGLTAVKGSGTRPGTELSQTAPNGTQGDGREEAG